MPVQKRGASSHKKTSPPRTVTSRPGLEVLENRLLPTSIIDLTLPGDTASAGYGINDSGQVIARSLSSTQVHYFIYSDGVITDLPVPPSGDSGELLFPVAINDSGQVVGRLYTNNEEHGFLYSDGAWTDLGTLLGNGAYGQANLDLQIAGINDFGQIVGSVNDASVGFIYSEGAGTTYLYPLLADNVVIDSADAINDSGQVAVDATLDVNGTATQTNHIFLYNDGAWTDLGTPLPGYQFSYPVAINDSGDVVGDTALGRDDPYATTAFLYTKATGMVSLGTLPGGGSSNAYGVNNSGQVVGASSMSNGPGHAFLYSEKTGMVDLNSLLPANSGWVLESAVGINNHGQIVGNGIDPRGAQAGFVLNLPGTVMPTALEWNTSDGGVDFSYQVNGATLTAPAPIAFYWASGPDFPADALQPLGYTYEIPAGTQAQDYGPIHVAGSELTAAPPGTEYLLAVADPDNTLGNFDPRANVQLVPASLPVLSPISDQTIAENTALALTVQATDPDNRPLTYYLDSGSPAGASIDPTRGVFTWIPAAAQVGQTFTIQVTAAVKNIPSLSDTSSFSVTVLSPFQVTGATRRQDVITLSFNEPLNPASARSPGSYGVVIVTPGTRHRRPTLKTLTFAVRYTLGRRTVALVLRRAAPGASPGDHPQDAIGGRPPELWDR